MLRSYKDSARTTGMRSQAGRPRPGPSNSARGRPVGPRLSAIQAGSVSPPDAVVGERSSTFSCRCTNRFGGDATRSLSRSKCGAPWSCRPGRFCACAALLPKAMPRLCPAARSRSRLDFAFVEFFVPSFTRRPLQRFRTCHLPDRPPASR